KMPAADGFGTYVLGAVLPVVLSPIVAWFLGRSRISKDSAVIDYINKRLDVIERLNKLQTQLAESPISSLLDTELEHSRAFLRQPPWFILSDAVSDTKAHQSRVARFFLVGQRAPSLGKRVSKGLFYFFFGYVILALFIVPIVLINRKIELTGPEVDVITQNWVTFFSLAGILVYFLIALGFRQLAKSRPAPSP